MFIKFSFQSLFHEKKKAWEKKETHYILIHCPSHSDNGNLHRLPSRDSRIPEQGRLC